MQARVRRRYAAERRFRLLGLARSRLSAAFLAFLLVTMAATAWAASPRPRSGSTIDFPKSDLFLDPAALKGRRRRKSLAGADLEGALAQAAIAAYGPTARANCSATARGSLGRDVDRRTRRCSSAAPTFWLPRRRSESTSPPRATAIAATERLVAKLEAQGRGADRAFNSDFLTGVRRHRSDRGRHLGRVQGLAADDAGDAAARLPDRRAVGASISRNMRRGTAGPT